MKAFLFFSLLIFLGTLTSNGATFVSNTSGLWGSDVWTMTSGADEDEFPDGDDQVSIINGNSITVNGTYACLTLSIGDGTSGGTLLFNTSSQLTVGGDITFNTGGTCTLNMTSGGTLIYNNISGTTTSARLTPGTGTIRTNNTASYTMPVNFRNFYNLTVASASTSNVVTIPDGNVVNINNNLTLNTNARLTLNCDSLTVTGQTSLSGFLVNTLSNVRYFFNNNVTVNSLGSYYTNTTGTTTINGNLTLNGGAFADTASSYTNHTVVINGNLSVNAGTSNTYGCGTLTVNGLTTVNGIIAWKFSTVGIKTFNNDVTVASTGNWNNVVNESFIFEKNFTIDGSITTAAAAVYTFSGTSTLSGSSANPNVGALTVNSGDTLVLDCTNPITIKGTLSGTGIATLAANRTVIFEGNASGFGGTFNFNNVGSKSIYSGTIGSQTIEVGSYYELEINKSSGSAIIQIGTTNVTTNLTITSGTLSLGNGTGSRIFNVSGSTLIAASGILSCNMSVTGSTGTKTFTGDITNNGSVSISGTSQAIFVMAGNISNNGTWTNTNANSRTTLSGSSTSITGNALTFNDCILNGTITNNVNLTINDSLSGSGTLTQGNGATLNLGSAFTTSNFDGSTNTNTVNYNGSGAQTIKAEDYHHLTIGNRSAAITLPASGTLFIKGNYTDNLTSSTYTVTGSTVNFNGSAQSILGSGINTAFNNLTISSGSTLTGKNGTVSIAGSFSVSGTYAHNNGTINYNGTSTQTIAAIGYNNLTISNRSATVTLGTGTISINATFTDNLSSGSYSVGTGTVDFSGTNTSITGSGTGTAFNNLDISTGTLTGKNGTVSIAGSFTISGTFLPNNGTINFNGSSAQTVPAINFHHLTISDRASAITLEGSETIYIAGNFTDNVTSGSYTVSGSTVEFSGTSSSISGTGTNTAFNNLSIASGATLTGKNSTVRIAGNFTNRGTYNHNNGNITFNGTNSSILGNGISTSFNDLTISSSTKLTGLNGTIGIAGSFTNNGVYNHNNGRLTFNAASGTQQLTGTGTTNLYDVMVSHASSGGISITQGTYNLFHSLDMAANTNTLDLGSNLLTLKSTGLSNDATARIGNLSNITTFSGTINLERFIGGNTNWRQMGTCMSNKTLADWYNASNFPMSGFTGVPSADGFVSAYTYNETLSAGNFDNGWVAATNITNSISPDDATLNGRGYTLYVGQTSNQTPMNNFTNTMSGSFIRGTRNITLTNQTPGGENSTSQTGFHVLSNPYPSQIDLSLGSWNAAIKGYYNLVNGSYLWNNGMTGIIPQGNAIMIFTDANNISMSFTEAMKTNANGTGTFMKNQETTPANTLELHINSNINTFEDQCTVFFNEKGDEAYVNASDDVRKLNSPETRAPRISTLTKEGIRTVQNDFAGLNKNFYLPMEVFTPYAGDFTIYGKGLYANGKCLVLVDKETGAEINLTKDFTYTFSSNTKKTYENRFAIVNKRCGISQSNSTQPIFRVNQNNHNLEVTLISEENKTGQLILMSLNGQVVFNKNNCSLSETESINTQGLIKGIYMVRFVSNEAVYSEKVVIE